LSRLVGSVARALYVGYGAVLIALVMGPLWLVTGFVKRPSRAVALQSLASRLMLAGLGLRFRIRGAWPAPDGRARLYVANHTSYLDIPLMLAALDRDFAFVTKIELLRWPLVARITRVGAHIAVDRARAESRGAVVARIIKTLRAGRDVFVFPEGTFSFDEGLRPFHSGAFHAAVAAGCDVVPIAVRGVAAMWSPHAVFPRPGHAELTVGDALPSPSGGDAAARMDSLRADAERFIAEHTGLARAS
jgi:1-acyl-sn-glycerol-3-phosphate acyltransferase